MMEYDNTRRGQIDICNSPRPYTAAQTLRQNNILRIYIMIIFECSREKSLIEGPNNIELAFPRWHSKVFTAHFSTLKTERAQSLPPFL